MASSVEDVKSIIRSLLISTQKSMSVFDLSNEFVASEGKPIPFQSLGYAKLTDFLKSIPDVLQLREGHLGGRMCYFVQPVVNNSTHHMESFVLGQNRRNKRGMRRSRGISSRGSLHRCKSTPPRRMALSSRNHYSPSNRGHSIPPRMSRQNLDRARQDSLIQNSPRTRDRSMSHQNMGGIVHTERSTRTDIHSRLGSPASQNISPARSAPRTLDQPTNLDGAPHTGRSTEMNSIRSRLGSPSRRSAPHTLDQPRVSHEILDGAHHTGRSTERNIQSRLGSPPTQSTLRTLDQPRMSHENLDGAPHTGRSTQMNSIYSRLGSPPSRSSLLTRDQSRMSRQDLDGAPEMSNIPPRRPSRWDQRPVTQSSTSIQSTRSDPRLTSNKVSLETASVRSRWDQVPQDTDSYRNTRDASPIPARTPQNVDGDSHVPMRTDSAVSKLKCKKISIDEYRKLRNQKNADPSVEPQGDEPTIATQTSCNPRPARNVEPQRSDSEEAPCRHMSGISAIPQLSAYFAKVFVRPCTDPETNQRTTACNSTATPSGAVVPARVLKLLLHLLDLYPRTGIPLVELRDKYKRYHKEALDYSGYGFNTLMEMVASLKDHVFAVPPEAPHTLFSMDCARDLKPCDEAPMNESSNTVVNEPKEQPSITIARHLQPMRRPMQPKDILVLGATLPPFLWPQEVEPEYNMRIRIEYVESPSKFFFTLPGKDHNEALQAMGLAMTNKYTHSKVSLRVRSLSKGLYVVVWKHSGVGGVPSIYHRAKILRVYDQNTCQILYIDVGEVCDEVRENLHYLLLEFAKLPAQAIQGFMFDLVPTSTDWTIIEMEYFSKMVRQGTVMVEVKHIDKAKMCVALDIIAKYNRHWCNIREEIIRLGMATNQSLSSASSGASSGSFRERHPISSVDVPMEAEQPQASNLDVERPTPFLDPKGDCMREILAVNQNAKPANIQVRNSPDQAQQGWRPILQQAMNSQQGSRGQQCIDLSSDSEIEVLMDAREEMRNRQRVYINSERWGVSIIHIVNYMDCQYLLLEEVAQQLFECTSGSELLICTKLHIKLNCKTVHESSLPSFFKELYSLGLQAYVRDSQIHLLSIESLVSMLRMFPKLKLRLLSIVTASMANFIPEDSCWYV